MKQHVQNLKNSTNVLALHSSLETTLQANGLDQSELTIGLDNESRLLAAQGREKVLLSDGTRSAVWRAPALRALFRNAPSALPHSSTPSPSEMPVVFRYMPIFFFIEEHVVSFCDATGDRSDQEFEETYRKLRRHPDAESSSQLHAFLWQVAAVVVGRRPVNSIEFQAIFERLAQSSATYQEGSQSWNYVATLRETTHLHRRAPHLAAGPGLTAQA